jgi:hypothetical protein
MSLDDPGSQHRQSTWLARAHDVRLPLWLRVAALAYGSHRRNGHAAFKPGWLAAVLEKPASDISKAIGRAKEYGFIDEASTARCLVVPSDKIAGGIGHPHDPCPVHDGKLSKTAKLVTELQRIEENLHLSDKSLVTELQVATL